MGITRKVATIMAILNFTGGIIASTGPVVACNRDNGINTKPGLLFGVAAVNWAHATMHLILGFLGFLSVGFHRFEQAYVRLNAGVFGALATAGWLRTGTTPGIFMVGGIAINWVDNIAHMLVASILLPFALIKKSD